jgi:non-specific serine/threonine protein kinase
MSAPASERVLASTGDPIGDHPRIAVAARPLRVAPAPLAEADDAVAEFARVLVDAGKVVPGLTIEADGRARSWWWPLPAARDREAIASLLADESVESHVAAAAALGLHVDREMRERLARVGIALTPRRPGRRTVPEAWLLSLAAADPHLPRGLDPERVRAFAELVASWVRSGALPLGRVRLCLRVREPPAAVTPEAARWRVELLVQDADEPSLTVPAAELWREPATFGPLAIEELLAGLGRLARLAPELAALLDDAAPTASELDAASFVTFARERVEPLADAGIVVLLPSSWTGRRRVGLRARVSSSSASGSGTAAGLGVDELLSFTWEAALGGRRLTTAELRALERAAAAKQPLVRVRGEWIEVDPAAVEAMLRHAGTTGEATTGELVRTGLGLGRIGEAASAPIVGVEADGWLGALIDDALHAAVTPIATPPAFAGTLRAYQERGVGWLAFLGRLGLGACLADDMGLGKTAQLIAAILADPAPGPTLVVCPVSVLGNWRRELERFAAQLTVLVHHGPDRVRGYEEDLATRAATHDVVLTTYSLVARDAELLAPVPWGRLVLDEAQQVKNQATAQARAVRRLQAGRRVALTGTPVENRLADLWSLMHILNPGLLGGASAFRERFAGPIERDADPDATALLRRITGPFVLRRLKTDRSIIGDLPDKIEQTELCRLTREQATLYQAVVDDLLAKADQADGIERRGLVLAGLVKLKQVCNHPAHFLRDGSRLPQRSGKLTRVEELLDEIVEAGDKALCFTQFAEWGALLAPHLARRYGREPLWLHGALGRARRDEHIAAFQDPGGPPIFLLSLKAGGTGLNLTAASYVIHLDRWWNPAVEDQATDRAYRIGQRRTVLVRKLVCAGTVEERIDEMITSKRELAKRVVGAGEDWLTCLSTEELREAIALRVPGVDD